MKYLVGMRSFLFQPYPFNDNAGNKLIVCGGIGAFITLFLGIFEPFGFDELAETIKWTHALAFGCITFLVAAVFQIVLPKVFPSPFREEAWRSWKEILFLLATTAATGAANFALMLYLYPQTITIASFLHAELITLQVGVFPVLFVVFMKQLMMYRRFAAEAKEASLDIPAVPEEKTALAQPAVQALELRGDNQKEVVRVLPGNLFFVSSADNYVKLQLREEATQKSAMLRSTLKKIEGQLAGHPQFFRCHRMYIVNLGLAEGISGNAQGLKLHLSGLDEAIPVSRNLSDAVRDRLHRLSRSPQNA